MQMDGLLVFVIVGKFGGEYCFLIYNMDCLIGICLLGVIVCVYGNQGMSDVLLMLCFCGIVGQSFGVFNVGGLQLEVEGEVNDYVGKGMVGGWLVVCLLCGVCFEVCNIVIIGNICLYGVIGGELFVVGCVGECFGVCNFGVLVVIEGVGDYCCEYMIDGIVLVLGKVGFNFGVGFIGGLVYVLDIDCDFVDCYNYELIDIYCIFVEGFENYCQYLYMLISCYCEFIGSIWVQQIFDEFCDYVGKFWLVKFKVVSIELLIDLLCCVV